MSVRTDGQAVFTCVSSFDCANRGRKIATLETENADLKKEEQEYAEAFSILTTATAKLNLGQEEGNAVAVARNIVVGITDLRRQVEELRKSHSKLNAEVNQLTVSRGLLEECTEQAEAKLAAYYEKYGELE